MQKKLRIIILLGYTLVTIVASSQEKEMGKISFEQLQDSMQIHPKSILIEIITDWCAICKLQEHQLMKDPKLVKRLAQKYYFLELNAETKNTIVFNSKRYNYFANGQSSGMNELAFVVGNRKGQLSYPTWVILNEKYEIIFQYAGLIKGTILNKL